MIRPLSTEDAEQLAEFFSSNRSFLRPFTPERPDSFFTVAEQREHLSNPCGSQSEPDQARNLLYTRARVTQQSQQSPMSSIEAPTGQ
jgi:hypothetical protein